MAKVCWMRGLALALSLGSAPAIASVEICNGRSDTMTVAIALAAKDAAGTSTGGHRGARVEGWWKLLRGECARVSDANAGQHWLYFHAHGESGSIEGRSRLCVRSKSFASTQSFLMKGQSCKGEWREAEFVRHESSARNYRWTVR